MNERRESAGSLLSQAVALDRDPRRRHELDMDRLRVRERTRRARLFAACMGAAALFALAVAVWLRFRAVR